ncbi:MAG: hypothetical protein O2848_00020 [Proteobacteria bacterium]|nr:hypothetical protein [Pseudomonadota bacterium]
MTDPAAVGHRRALAYGPLAVVLGLSTAWLSARDPSAFSGPLPLGALIVACLLAGQLLVRRYARVWLDDVRGWPRPIQMLGRFGWSLLIVLGVHGIFSESWSRSSLGIAVVLGVVMMGHQLFLSQAGSSATRQAAVTVYVASFLLALAGLYGWVPVACVWASVAAVPAFHARRLISTGESSDAEAARLLTASIFGFVLIMTFAVALSAVLAARGMVQA